ncbi:MAG TPA: hypothetical protein VNW47_13005 [Terriglobales bacterium]|jgi:hypothetical protein|nr:hypothetical protein [Terriglobales bacterium]
MRVGSQRGRYNQAIPHMHVRWSGSLRMGWLASFLFLAAFFISISFLLALAVFPASASASVFGESARLLAHKIASATGPGAVAFDFTNRSSLDDKSVREVRSALEAQLRSEGVRTAKADESMGSVQVTLSESVREYVWTAEIAIGADAHKVVLVAAPRAQLGVTASSSSMPLAVRKSFLFAQEQPILDAAVLDVSGGQRLLVLDASRVGVFRQQNGRWELEASLASTHARTFPRDLRGRLLLRRDHLFDVYLPGTICRSSASGSLTLACFDSEDPWPLTSDEGGVRASFTPARNFFTGAFSPGIGKVSNGPSFYSAAALPKSGYTLWVLAGVDGSIHMLDGMTDQLLRGAKWGSDLAALHSSCGTGTQLLVSENGEPSQDSLRAFEIPDREPVAASAPVEFDGPIVALWTESGGNGAIAIVKREDTGWYEAYRISIACGS